MAKYYDSYMSASERAKLAGNNAKKLKKKSADLSPVIIEGRTIAKTWWGKAWNDNLESYADYSNRIGRGKSYVRSGAVVDLQIDKGTVKARVQGTKRTPYTVNVIIDQILPRQYQKILEQCSHRIENIEALANGSFPAELVNIFTAKNGGLFPAPKEIHFSCSCPDWAYMCKHVAAVLYGIGSRLDHDPLLFFTLRDIDMSDFIKKSVEDKLQTMLKNAQNKSDRVIEENQLEELFGVL